MPTVKRREKAATRRDNSTVELTVPQQRVTRELVIVFTAFGWLGMMMPDFDQAMLPILHHRSIVTHGMLIPLVLLLWRRHVLGDAMPGLMVGIAIHLAADLTSPASGFGSIWLPWPVKLPLGPLSPLWLFANAVIGMAWWRIVMLRWSRTERLVCTAIGLVMAALYAIYNERAMTPLMLFIVVAGIGYAVAPRLERIPWFARLTTCGQASKRADEQDGRA